MELPHMGTNCAESNCRQLDFLPFTCDLCKKEFCVDHHVYDKHNCSESYRRDVQVPICPLCDQPVPSKRDQPPDLAVNDHLENNCKSKNKKIYTNRCSFGGCKTKEMIPVCCDSCTQNFCLRHRHTVDHECKGPPPAPSLRERAVAAASSRMGNLSKKSTSNGSVGNRNSGNSRNGTGSSSSTAATVTQGIARYFTPVSARDRQPTAPRPTGNVASSRSTNNVSLLQGGLSESEALARAMAESIQQQPVSQSSGGQSNRSREDVEDEDAMLARAIAASLEENQRGSRQQQSLRA